MDDKIFVLHWQMFIFYQIISTLSIVHKRNEIETKWAFICGHRQLNKINSKSNTAS